jgi:general secretion pathway protein K
MTIYGITSAGKNTFTYKGKININTAELPVLIALLPSENEDFALLIFNYRQETTDSKYINDLSDPAWYKNAPGCSDIQIDPGLITASSDLFRIESTATLNEMETTTVAVVRRENDKKTGKWMCRVLSWQTE